MILKDFPLVAFRKWKCIDLKIHQSSMRILRKKKKETGHTLTSWKGAWSCPDNEDLLADAENGAARYEKEISRTLFFRPPMSDMGMCGSLGQECRRRFPLKKNKTPKIYRKYSPGNVQLEFLSQIYNYLLK